MLCGHDVWLEAIEDAAKKCAAADGPLTCFSDLPQPFNREEAANVMRAYFEQTSLRWTERTTMTQLWHMKGTLLAKDGTLSLNAQTNCFSQMLPEASRKLFRNGTKTDTARAGNLWLRRDAAGNIHEAKADEAKPTWVLLSSAQSRR
jgi:hypothetical protein